MTYKHVFMNMFNIQVAIRDAFFFVPIIVLWLTLICYLHFKLIILLSTNKNESCERNKCASVSY